MGSKIFVGMDETACNSGIIFSWPDDCTGWSLILYEFQERRLFHFGHSPCSQGVPDRMGLVKPDIAWFSIMQNHHLAAMASCWSMDKSGRACRNCVSSHPKIGLFCLLTRLSVRDN
jgi:hypothetical protein